MTRCWLAIVSLWPASWSTWREMVAFFSATSTRSAANSASLPASCAPSARCACSSVAARIYAHRSVGGSVRECGRA
eukprot:364353-Chlamydomonas_euryale.AAC.1